MSRTIQGWKPVVACIGLLTAMLTSARGDYEWRQASITGVLNANSCWLYLYTSNTLAPVYMDDVSMVAGSVAESGQNLVVNPGFESGTNGWDMVGNSAASSVTASPRRSGTTALRLAASPATASGGSGNSVKQAVLGMTSGQVYTLSFWYAATNDVGFMVRYSAHTNMQVFREVVSTATVEQTSSPSAFDYSSMRLIDWVDCATDSSHDFTQNTASVVQTLLDSPCRTFSDPGQGMKFFAYRIGEGLGLQAASNYVLRVTYPHDEPRAMFIINRGCEMARGLRTGRSTGDAMKPPYVTSNPESLEIPLSGSYENWECLFRLQERFPGMKQPRYDNDWPRDQLPSNGLWVIFMQFDYTNDPMSRGVAVQRIELYEAPPLETMAQALPELPSGLPRRHLFWREEMADGLVGSSVLTERGFADDMTWYEGKFELMRFLGMNTFSKDLLEFGYNQGWDSDKYGGSDWFYQTPYPTRWTKLVRRCGELGFDVLPYYEYKGARGYQGLGEERRCRPVYPDTNGDYTGIPWTDSANADVTDPDTLEDLRRVLEITVTDEKANAEFLGVWIRTRVTDLPVSFSDRCLELFRVEKGYSFSVTRNMLFFQDAQYDAALYDEYRTWWFEKRKVFLDQVRDYLHQAVSPSMKLLFTADHMEAGKPLVWPNQTECIAENPGAWTNMGMTVRSLADALAGHWQWDALTSDVGTYGTWEWHHSIPPPDPQRYTDEPGILMTHTLNRAYTAEAVTMEGFRGMEGLACIRHYTLNEHVPSLTEDEAGIGYFVSDVDYAGPYVMLPEALAVAYGDPFYLGYLASHHFNRGDPYYVRRFNANFLALPALASSVATGMNQDADLMVRRIDTPRNGIYLAAVNVGRTRKTMTIQLPEPGRLVDGVTGMVLGDGLTGYSLTMDPCELRTLRFFPEGANTPPEITTRSYISLEWFNALSTHAEWQTVQLSAEARDWDVDGQPLASVWTLRSGAASQVEIQTPARLETWVAFRSPGTNIFTITVSDGLAASTQEVTVVVGPHKHRIVVTSNMVSSLSLPLADSGLFNQQADTGEPPVNQMGSQWAYDGRYPMVWPMDTLLDLQQTNRITEVWLYDDIQDGPFYVYAGTSSNGPWDPIVYYGTSNYAYWITFNVDASTRYLKFTQGSGNAFIGEVVLYGEGGGFSSDSNIPMAPVTVDIAGLTSNAMELSINANPFQSYTLEMSRSLTSNNWQTVQTWTTTNPFPALSIPCTNDGAFYRVRETPR